MHQAFISAVSVHETRPDAKHQLYSMNKLFQAIPKCTKMCLRENSTVRSENENEGDNMFQHFEKTHTAFYNVAMQIPALAE